MLEKMAEMVREDAKEANDNYGLLPCMVCDGRPADSERCLALGRSCPDMQNPDGSLMVARYAVLLVAGALETLPDAKEQDLRQLKSGKKLEDRSKTEQAEYVCAMSNLGIDFMNLLSDATISAREAKEAAHE